MEIINRVKEAVLAEQNTDDKRPSGGQSAGSYGLTCAYSKGLIDGAKAFLDAFDNLEFETEGESNE